VGVHPMRTIVYVDGFNLYYRLLEKRPALKWLDLEALVRLVLGAEHNIIKIRYYTARVSGRLDADAPRRQQIYLDALSSLPLVQVHFGTFLEKQKWAGLVRPPLDPSDRDARLPFLKWPDVAYVWKTEEKGSDVNLASHLLLDAFQGTFEVAAVLSNDTDLIEPLRIATEVLGKPVGLLSPVKKPSSHLVNVASFLRHVKASHAAKCQFPDPVRLSSGKEVHKSDRWV
jgi:NYN domain